MTLVKALLCVALLLASPVHAQDNDRLPGEWRIALAGDIMLGTDYPTRMLPPNEGRGLLDAAGTSLSWADVAIGNQEGTFGEGGVTGKLHCQKCYAFRTPSEIARRLSEAGFEAMAMANNHARDFGDNGLLKTQQALRSVGIQGTGWQGSTPAVFRRGSESACLLAFAPNAGMNDLRDIPMAALLVRKAKTECTVVIVSFHGGAEGANKTHTPYGAELYLGENRGDVRAFARAMVDAGAGIVFGHGPHVPRGMELYRGHLIAYSLGNFMTYGGMNVSGVLGQAPLLLVRIGQDGRLISGRIVPFIQTPKSPLRVDPQLRAIRTIVNATQQDFEGGSLSFTVDGGFHPR